MVKNNARHDENAHADEKTSFGSTGDDTRSNQTSDARSNPSQSEQHQGDRLAIWERIKGIPMHNRIELFFTAVIAFATVTYAFVSCNQLTVMENSIVVQKQIAKFAYGSPIINRSALTRIYHDEQSSQVWAVVGFQNDGQRDARFIRVAARLDFRDIDPIIDKDFYFSETDFQPTKPNNLSKGSGTVDSTNDLRREISPRYKDKRLYVWGRYTYEDTLGNSFDGAFCRYAIQDILANAPGGGGGYGGPYNDCKTPTQ